MTRDDSLATTRSRLKHIAEIDAAFAGNTILLDGLNRLLGLLKQDRSDDPYPRELFTHSLVYTYWCLRIDFPDLTWS